MSKRLDAWLRRDTRWLISTNRFSIAASDIHTALKAAALAIVRRRSILYGSAVTCIPTISLSGTPQVERIITAMKLSVVIPVYDGAETIERLVDTVFESLPDHVDVELILVNDGSRDASWERIVSLHDRYSDSMTAIDLAKNFGEHNAVMAGYRHCTGDFIVNIDDDFQNPPGEILKLLSKIQEGLDCVYSVYAKKEHSMARNLGSWINDRVANIMLDKPKNLYLSSFRIISASLLEQIVQYDGPFPYIDGLILRSTSRIGHVETEHSPRTGSASNYTLVKLLRLASHMFFNFSLTPLRWAVAMGMLFSTVGFVGAVAFVIEKLMFPDTQMGWASQIVATLILSGINLFMLGIIGEYVGRIFLYQGKTPQYVAHEIRRRGTSPSTGSMSAM